jgi:hypothetical protein
LKFQNRQQVILENLDTGEHIQVTIVQHDSKMGFLAIDSKDNWTWHHEESNAEFGWGKPYYKFVKKVKKNGNRKV